MLPTSSPLLKSFFLPEMSFHLLLVLILLDLSFPLEFLALPGIPSCSGDPSLCEDTYQLHLCLYFLAWVPPWGQLGIEKSTLSWWMVSPGGWCCPLSLCQTWCRIYFSLLKSSYSSGWGEGRKGKKRSSSLW
uniref:Uncharacterized protein n=1 Tax=Pipistrellus kuhlii TaxID=59472 RepID=A0A7J8A808_PIPKU|nr:hypothetical protein mPipKuh1_009008 [Pipistrellus kuhlii]